jgi:phosphatidylserine/phosphatidylglycerophosphate/cardiolipin synthase-like enzyme/LAS superfamily LD-carboxypeptidase LdcB
MTIDETAEQWASEMESPFQLAGEGPALLTAGLMESERWSDAAEQVAFREAVLAAHIARTKQRKGPAHPDLQLAELTVVPGTKVKMATAAAAKAGELLQAANRAITDARSASRTDIGATVKVTGQSGYRGSEHQARLWRAYFTRYYNQTDQARQRLAGGPHSPAAVKYMLDVYKIPRRIAAPGYSNHQAGIAIDFRQVLKGKDRIRNSTDRAAIQRWRTTWFYRWLQQHAARFGFQPYTAEPWHWEYRPDGAQREEEALVFEMEEPESERWADEEQWGPEEAEEPELEGWAETEQREAGQSEDPELEGWSEADRWGTEKVQQPEFEPLGEEERWGAEEAEEPELEGWAETEQWAAESGKPELEGWSQTERWGADEFEKPEFKALGEEGRWGAEESEEPELEGWSEAQRWDGEDFEEKTEAFHDQLAGETEEEGRDLLGKLFDAYSARSAEDVGGFSVVARPSRPLQVPLRAGDLVIARGVPFTSLSVLAGPSLRDGARLEPPGQYATVLSDPASGIPQARRVLDLHGVVPPNTLILRPREAPQPLTEAAPSPAVSGAAYWQAQLRLGLAGNRVRPLVDGPDAFAAIQRAIETAVGETHYIYLLGWWVDPWVNLTGPGTSLLDLFTRAGERRVQIRVLMWDSPALIPAFANHSQLHDAAETALNRIPYCHAQQDAGGGLISPRSHHQKLLVVNGRDGLVALCGGVDVNADRIHQLPPPAGAVRSDRPRVGWISSSGSGAGGAGEPLHDVHALVTGPTALPLLRMFLRRWWARSGNRDIDRHDPLRGRYSQPVPPPTGSQFVRVGETFDGVLAEEGKPRVLSRKRDVQDIWLRSLLGARRFIYMEEQYLSHLCAAEAIKRVLPRLEHVTILIPPSEITDFPGVWRRRQAFINRITSGNPHAGKLHVYTRVVGEPGACRRDRGPHLYVHSKMAVIDDQLMLIGSANCNHRGWESDSELVLATFEDTLAAASTAARLRVQLWAHHLGVSPSAVADPMRSRGLWDMAPARHVCPYDPAAGRDSGGVGERDAIADPTSRRSDDPCCTLLRLCP